MTNTDFLIKSINSLNLEQELENIGFDNTYSKQAIKKFQYKTLKIFDLTCTQANILKQTALSVGADCATHKDTITAKTEKTDVILGGSFSQLIKISEKLNYQPFSLKTLSNCIINQLTIKNNPTKLVGILNITDNSFSDGGEYNTTEKACNKFKQLISDGADIIDIGAESTKPNTQPVPEKDQLNKILPVLKFGKTNYPDIKISIDTKSSIVADEVLNNGADIINDTSGLKYDNKMAEIIAKHNATLILQHSSGKAVNMEEYTPYNNVIDDVFTDLSKQVKFAKESGINNIIIDVGFGFDKSLEDNFKIFNRIDDFASLGYPLLTGISRKSMLNLNDSDNKEKDIFTLALNTIFIEHNIDYLRVHDVKSHKKLLNIYKKI